MLLLDALGSLCISAGSALVQRPASTALCCQRLCLIPSPRHDPRADRPSVCHATYVYLVMEEPWSFQASLAVFESGHKADSFLPVLTWVLTRDLFVSWLGLTVQSPYRSTLESHIAKQDPRRKTAASVDPSQMPGKPAPWTAATRAIASG